MKASENKSGATSWIIRILRWVNFLIAACLIGAYVNTHVSPNSVPLIAFLGLGYPILLCASLLFLILWLFIKSQRKWMLLPLLSILAGFSHLSHFYAVTFFQSKLENPIKVMSYNVHVFNLYDLENRVEKRNENFTFLKEQNPDIVCFQEFYHQDGQAEFVTRDSLIELLEMPYYHERFTHALVDEQYFGQATFSKFPIIYKGEISFENDPYNYCIFSDLLINGDTIRVFNAHLGSIRFADDDYRFFGDEDGPQRYLDNGSGQRILRRLKDAFERRAIQSELVAAEIDKSPYPVVLCMDMNDTPVSYSYRQFGSRLIDGFIRSGNGIGQTYIGEVPSNRIDYIFHSEDFVSSNFTVHQVNYSDHKPVSCEIELSN